MTHSAILLGIGSEPVLIIAEPHNGDDFRIIGLHNPSAYRETLIRVRSALATVGLSAVLTQRTRVTLMLPVTQGSAALDLAIAVAVATAYDDAPSGDRPSQTLLVGELSLGGELRPVRGLVPMLRGAAERGLRHAVVPRSQLDEASVVSDVETFGAATLSETLAWLRSKADLPKAPVAPRPLIDPRGPVYFPAPETEPCLSEVVGQEAGKRALEIAATGNHHLLFVGCPGAGKTMLARRLSGILPRPTAEERLEIATIASASGLTSREGRPFRAPHHTASAGALVGDAVRLVPGEVTLAHGGVLFLDEMPDFGRGTLEEISATVHRGTRTLVQYRGGKLERQITMPAAPLVVAAMNPCPCGWIGAESHMCQCQPRLIDSYRARLAPMSDLLALRVELQPTNLRTLATHPPSETSATIRARVLLARTRRDAILARETAEGHDVLTHGAHGLLESASFGNDALALRIADVARTCAALSGCHDVVAVDHVYEAAALCNPPCAPFV